MRAAVLHEVGGPLVLEDLPEPGGGPVVDVRAAGINFADVLVRRGLYPQMPELPTVPGFEVAGELDGRRVLAIARNGRGGYAERAAVEPGWVFPLPARASFAAGASFLLAYLTAYIPLYRRVRPGPGSTVIVHAASGGVGSAAIQLAKDLGARVIATASTPEKRAFALDVGADAAVGYDEIDDLHADVILDLVGGDVFTRSLALLNPLGTIVAIGYANGLWPDPSVQWLVGRNVSVAGVYVNRLLKLAPDLVHACVEELLALWEAGRIDPVVGSRFPLADADAAYALIESRGHTGKVVLEV
jgi:NADPH:quinone reductase